MVSTAETAVEHIRSGQRVFIGTGCGEPTQLVQALCNRSSELTDIEILHLLTLGTAPYANMDMEEHFRVNSFFIAQNVRHVIQQGLGDYTPIFLSDIPQLFRTGHLPLDVALIQVSPPDGRGICSLGISVDIVKSAAQNASCVIAEVNPRMPRTHGDCFLNVHEIDILVPVDRPLLEFTLFETDEVTRRIGENIASLVEDGSTLELGIGRIPHATAICLKEKKDLGINTEMFTDAIIDLIESGVVTGTHKFLDKGKIVASFCLGTKKLYDYIDDNPKFYFYPTEYVNDPHIIAQQHKMVAINVALEVDLTGQVCADSLGTKFFSGIGGQLDFNRGAARSPGGKAIIALPSTACNETVSRIVSRLSSGAGVVTTRGDVHYVVTEYGVAYLHGKNVQERAMSLISIAHPKFRAKLLREAVEAKFLRAELSEIEGKITTDPRNLRTPHVLNDGTQILFRSIHPTDEHRLKGLFYTLSKETIYYRFFTRLKRLPQRQIQDFVYIDHRNDVAIVGVLPETPDEEIIAVGRYYLDKNTNLAEVAFVVNDSWQRKGLGTFLLNYLILTAKRNGIGGFTAEVLAENKAMQKVFNQSNCKVNSRFNGESYSYEIIFK